MRVMTALAFDAAHRILGHSGKCYPHGHLAITVGAERLNSLGTVMDFDDLRVVVKKAVLDGWDVLIRETPTCATELGGDRA